MGPYDKKPVALLSHIGKVASGIPCADAYCAGFELSKWRCDALANHLIEWLPEYALSEPELDVHHGNAYSKLRQAAIRVYSSKNYEKRGEVGEIALHAICRQFFGTLPISPRVFYKSSSNDVVKSFDLVHARFGSNGDPEIWLGESKIYGDRDAAIAAAISSINDHLKEGFLKSQKIILGPQIPTSTPGYEELRTLFADQTSLDALLNAAVFTVGILADSDAAKGATKQDGSYTQAAIKELELLSSKLVNSGLTKSIRLQLIYVPLATKSALLKNFDSRLKALQ